MPRAIAPLLLSPDQHSQIERCLAALGTPQQVALRCRIILAVAAGKTEVAIAADHGVNRKNRPSLARAIPQSRSAGALGDRSGPGTETCLRCCSCQGGDRRHFANQAEGKHALELPDHGGRAEDQ